MKYSLEIFTDKKKANPLGMTRREYVLSISDSFDRDLKSAFLNKNACKVIGSLFIFDYNDEGEMLSSSQKDVFQNEVINFSVGISINQKIANLALKFDEDLKSATLANVSLLSKVSGIASGNANTTKLFAM